MSPISLVATNVYEQQIVCLTQHAAEIFRDSQWFHSLTVPGSHSALVMTNHANLILPHTAEQLWALWNRGKQKKNKKLFLVFDRYTLSHASILIFF